MLRGSVSARAVAIQDLTSDLKVLDKKEVSLGVLNQFIDEQSNRSLEDEVKQKYKDQIEMDNKSTEVKNYDEMDKDLENKEKEEKENENENEKEKKEKSIDDGENDLII